jgi:hypothetical protein
LRENAGDDGDRGEAATGYKQRLIDAAAELICRAIAAAGDSSKHRLKVGDAWVAV